MDTIHAQYEIQESPLVVAMAALMGSLEVVRTGMANWESEEWRSTREMRSAAILWITQIWASKLFWFVQRLSGFGHLAAQRLFLVV